MGITPLPYLLPALHSTLTTIPASPPTNSAASLYQAPTEDCSSKRHPITQFSVSQDGKYVVAASGLQSLIRVWNLQTRKAVSTLTDPAIIGFERFAISPDNQYIVTGGNKGIPILWNPQSGHKIRVFPTGNTSAILGLVFSPDSKYLLVVDFISGSLWDVKTGLKLHEVAVISGNEAHAEFSPDGKQFLIERAIWDTATGQRVQTLDRFEREPLKESRYTLLFSPDGKYIFIEDPDQALLVDAKGGSLVYRLEGISADDIILDWKFSPTGKYLAAKGQVAALVWEVGTGKKARRFDFPDPQPDVIFFPDERRVLLPERGHVATNTPYTIYDLVANVELKRLVLDVELPLFITITPDNKYLITRADYPTPYPQSILQIWDVETGNLVGEYC